MGGREGPDTQNIAGRLGASCWAGVCKEAKPMNVQTIFVFTNDKNLGRVQLRIKYNAYETFHTKSCELSMNLTPTGSGAFA